MALRAVKQCFKCKQQFRREELINYCTARAKTGHDYCPRCLEEVQASENFSNEICKIFGVKAPGPQINTERKRLRDEYGYTDQTILDCLHYVYDVKHIEKKKVTLYFVNPTMIEEMKKYQRTQQAKGSNLARAMTTQFNEYVVPVREATPRKKQLLNPDDYFDD